MMHLDDIGQPRLIKVSDILSGTIRLTLHRKLYGVPFSKFYLCPFKDSYHSYLTTNVQT